jgi:hypothetical protein
MSFSVDGRTLVVTERGTDSISTYLVSIGAFEGVPATVAGLAAS